MPSDKASLWAHVKSYLGLDPQPSHEGAAEAGGAQAVEGDESRDHQDSSASEVRGAGSVGNVRKTSQSGEALADDGGLGQSEDEVDYSEDQGGASGRSHLEAWRGRQREGESETFVAAHMADWKPSGRSKGLGEDGTEGALQRALGPISRGWAHLSGKARREADLDARFPVGPLAEHATQYPKGEEEAREEMVTFTIGLDWGTSATKVIVRDLYGLNTPCYLIDFGELGHPEQSYLLPSQLYIDRRGQARLKVPRAAAKGGAQEAAGKVARTGGAAVEAHIKLNLMRGAAQRVKVGPEGCLSALCHEIAALYIAAVLRRVRTSFLREHAATYRQYLIEWEVNLGIPAATFDDESTCGLFREVLRVGWWLSAQEGALTVERAREAFHRTEEAGFDVGLDDHAINVVPEVAAQVVGYARSSLRTTGLHLLVDVGAATLDVAGFILYEREGDDRYSILEALVMPRGAFKLHEKRVQAVLEGVDSWGRSDIEGGRAWCDELRAACTPMTQVPATLEAYYPDSVRVDVVGQLRQARLDASRKASGYESRYVPALFVTGERPGPKQRGKKRGPSPRKKRRDERGNAEVWAQKCVAADDEFDEACRVHVHKVVAALRQKRDPRSPAWKAGLPVFLCGGGHTVNPYKNGMARMRQWWEGEGKVAPFRVMALPQPENLHARGIREQDYHRISVAYGLSFSVYDIGEMRPPSSIADFRVPQEERSRVLQEDTRDWM